MLGDFPDDVGVHEVHGLPDGGKEAGRVGGAVSLDHSPSCTEKRSPAVLGIVKLFLEILDKVFIKITQDYSDFISINNKTCYDYIRNDGFNTSIPKR